MNWLSFSLAHLWDRVKVRACPSNQKKQQSIREKRERRIEK